MGKNAHLADIYIKIYNKQTLTLDDLSFLAQYDPECFAKTCQNLIYNIPETRELMTQEPEEIEEKTQEKPVKENIVSPEERVKLLLENLRKMKMEEIPVKEVDPDRVKNLLGSLYMEMLFPHNDKSRYFEMKQEPEEAKFNKKV